ncbi:ABSCISIC ACID-INSENSITIVE 5-like protein 3 isoform X2 [Vicia villosa]|uniref:ABSCISIC ACID-INSENSITIVE 5-like protein 3 isoform X2 n=1 Tax=Vicia villosa TaxID=3911 RepID=UPI00273B1AE9|nr:ABSCISIC ACID-INSENSITIVE 5-like protein 3 isoform X2 [Vicia villosa]
MASSKVVAVSTNPDLPRASPISSSTSSFHLSHSSEPPPKKPTTMDEILKNIYPAAIRAAEQQGILKQEQQEEYQEHQEQHQPHFLFNNTIDDVLKDFVTDDGAGTTSYHPDQYQYQDPYQHQYQYQYQNPSSDESFSTCTGGGDNTLEDFLMKAGALPFSNHSQYSSSSEPSHSLDVAAGGKRKAVEEAVDLDKAAIQKQKRMIKNRESAARSRERKQAYTNELERVVKQLETENKLLIEEEKGKRKG